MEEITVLVLRSATRPIDGRFNIRKREKKAKVQKISKLRKTYSKPYEIRTYS